MENLNDYILNLFEQKYILLGAILCFSIFSYLFMRYIVIKALFHLFQKTSNTIDDILIENGLFNRLSYIDQP